MSGFCGGSYGESIPVKFTNSAPSSLLVQTLGISLLCDGKSGVDEDFDELFVADQFTGGMTLGLER